MSKNRRQMIVLSACHASKGPGRCITLPHPTVWHYRSCKLGVTPITTSVHDHSTVTNGLLITIPVTVLGTWAKGHYCIQTKRLSVN
jgi:hypothetical protein